MNTKLDRKRIKKLAWLDYLSNTNSNILILIKQDGVSINF